MKIGCLNKNTNITEYIYYHTRFKSLGQPFGEEPYCQYEIVDGTKPEQYMWNGQNVILDPNYVEPQPDYTQIIQNSIKYAIAFGQNLIIEFAAENVLMGITQAGKTKDVADYLANVTRYIQTGSLYEVINEIDRLKLEGFPQNLEPFITEARLDGFKQKVLDYLT